jgi:hypothetical protein
MFYNLFMCIIKSYKATQINVDMLDINHALFFFKLQKKPIIYYKLIFIAIPVFQFIKLIRKRSKAFRN